MQPIRVILDDRICYLMEIETFVEFVECGKCEVLSIWEIAMKFLSRLDWKLILRREVVGFHLLVLMATLFDLILNQIQKTRKKT